MSNDIIDNLELCEQVEAMIGGGALVVVNHSGGKDSQAMLCLLADLVPPDQMLVVHASLGQAEWPGALEHAQAGASSRGLPFVVAKARKTFFDMVERRHTSRPETPCWPSASNRQCTSDLKRDPIAREVRRYMKERGLTRVLNCMGIRADESPRRAKAVTLKRSERNSKAGRDWWEWLPIHHLTVEQVFCVIRDAGEQPHEAYAKGNDRLSCMFCIMGSRNDLRNAALNNPDLYRRYVEMEERTGYTMHQSRTPLVQLTGIPA